jgi:transposase InsO family protein
MLSLSRFIQGHRRSADFSAAGQRDVRRRAAAVAPNVLDRSFAAPAPNRRWIVDFTYVWTAEGWLYVAAVIDLFSRRVVGWSMSADMTAQLVADALVMAMWRRGRPDALLTTPIAAVSTPANSSSA